MQAGINDLYSSSTSSRILQISLLWGFTSLTQILGLGMAGVAAVGAAIAAVWAAVGLYVGRTVEQIPESETEVIG